MSLLGFAPCIMCIDGPVVAARTGFKHGALTACVCTICCHCCYVSQVYRECR